MSAVTLNLTPVQRMRTRGQKTSWTARTEDTPLSTTRLTTTSRTALAMGPTTDPAGRGPSRGQIEVAPR